MDGEVQAHRGREAGAVGVVKILTGLAAREGVVGWTPEESDGLGPIEPGLFGDPSRHRRLEFDELPHRKHDLGLTPPTATDSTTWSP